MARFLFDVEQKNRLEQKGLLKRFSIKCYGVQDTLETMRAEKMSKYKELKHNKKSREYEMWFLKYTFEHDDDDNVNVNVNDKFKRKTQRTRKRKNRTKRRTTRISSDFLF